MIPVFLVWSTLVLLIGGEECFGIYDYCECEEDNMFCPWMDLEYGEGGISSFGVRYIALESEPRHRGLTRIPYAKSAWPSLQGLISPSGMYACHINIQECVNVNAPNVRAVTTVSLQSKASSTKDIDSNSWTSSAPKLSPTTTMQFTTDVTYMTSRTNTKNLGTTFWEETQSHDITVGNPLPSSVNSLHNDTHLQQNEEPSTNTWKRQFIISTGTLITLVLILIFISGLIYFKLRKRRMIVRYHVTPRPPIDLNNIEMQELEDPQYWNDSV